MNLLRRRSLRKRSLLLTALMLFASFSALSSTNVTIVEEQSQKAIISSYTAHAPILINGNTQFLDPKTWTGISWGSGSKSDPYIIEGWEIDASSSNGIDIRNTTAHFIVRDCYIGGSGGYTGIYLNNCNNGTLERNTCSNNEYGILLSHRGYLNNYCSNNTLSYNTCSSNDLAGICLYTSGRNNAISNNTCSNNEYGILIYFSDRNNVISHNACSNNEYGIFISSDSNILSHNTCSNNVVGVRLDNSRANNLSFNSCSSNNETGIFLADSYSNTLSYNICSSNNNSGIYLGSRKGGYGSCYNTLTWNQLCDNRGYGVDIGLGSWNRIWNNTFIGNNGAGSVYDVNHIQACDNGRYGQNGTGNQWNSSGTPYGYGNYWGDLTAPNTAAPLSIVDNPYNLSGIEGAKDYFPLNTPPSSGNSGDNQTATLLLISVVAAGAVLAAIAALVILRARKKKLEPPMSS